MADTPNADTEKSNTNANTSKENQPAEELMKPVEVLRDAREQLEELTGMTVESVSSFEPSKDGWRLEIEVLELERVPDTMSLLASYEVLVDSQGELSGYRRLRRYERGRADPHRGH
ncbi:gas vesicle protein [Streptomyces cavernae]|uniref:gas vesicle protein GvpO n=1 Tax=Streptomyces cavernae TaxID=2259034 RepID=UPI000FEBE2CA|nr:gas vesicle protein [Streptomyces cavernae]